MKYLNLMLGIVLLVFAIIFIIQGKYVMAIWDIEIALLEIRLYIRARKREREWVHFCSELDKLKPNNFDDKDR